MPGERSPGEKAGAIAEIQDQQKPALRPEAPQRAALQGGEEVVTNVTGSLFLAGALMLWGGWILLPRRVGMFFQSDDFSAIGNRLHLWLWLYRVHLFGVVVSALALAALAALADDVTPLR